MAKPPSAIGVLTSGGDAQGMNAALRAVVRAALGRGASVYGIYEGYKGLILGGDSIKKMAWGDVGGILQKGGTIIGTARSKEFQTREGRLTAAQNLLERGIGGLVVIGGDGSLTGASIFREEWPGLVAELLETKRITPEVAKRVETLAITGLVGSIDNDMFGTDMTIGADSALHRITEAMDALSSTAASHQRAFIVEVMGRHCGYLALMSTISGGGDWVLIPENPPADGWETAMCNALKAGRKAGRRDSIVVVAEGARDRHGKPITSEYVKKVIDEQLREDVRVTILGHVQRGGSPSAYDRWMSTLVGSAAANEILTAKPEAEPKVIGVKANRVSARPLMESVRQTRQIAEVIEAGDYERAMEMRGGSFQEMFQTVQTMTHTAQRTEQPLADRKRILVLNTGDPAPGMNTAVRAAVRLGLYRGHRMFVARNGFRGLLNGEIEEFAWKSVDGWGGAGGSELGTSRRIPYDEEEIKTIAQYFSSSGINALMVIGGWQGYETAYKLMNASATHAALKIPIVCIPAAVDNNLPASEFSIGADTGLNNIVNALDKVKQTAVATGRCLIVEVRGGQCGYLALMSGISCGAERVYSPEEGVRMADMQVDLENMLEDFRGGKRLGLIIRNEEANKLYTTEFMRSFFEEEGGEHFEARAVILGDTQMGGNPTPFDRIQATRLAARGVEHLQAEMESATSNAMMVGSIEGKLDFTPLVKFPAMFDMELHRPREQWWREMGKVAKKLASSATSGN